MKKLFRKKNQEIEKQMKLEQEKQNKTLKILLLGPATSGKSTLLKQMKKIDNNFDEKQQCKSMTQTIKSAVVRYMKTLCQNKNICDNADIQALQNDILQLEAPFDLTKDVGNKIQTLWDDADIKETLKQKQKFKCSADSDTIRYFLDKMPEIAVSDYCPSFEDCLRLHTDSKGFQQTTITTNIDEYGEHIFEFTDIGGQKSEIKKWIKFIAEDVHAVLYVVSLSDYDCGTDVDDVKSNSILDAIQLFKTIAMSNKGKFFKDKSIYVMLNKFDRFEEKIKNIPISVGFDDFPHGEMNPNDENDAVRFVVAKFLQVLDDENIELSEPIHVIRSNALCQDNTNKTFSDISVNLINKILCK